VTEWDEFKKPSAQDFKLNMARPLIIDGRRILEADKLSKDLEYLAIGLGPRGQSAG